MDHTARLAAMDVKELITNHNWALMQRRFYSMGKHNLLCQAWAQMVWREIERRGNANA